MKIIIDVPDMKCARCKATAPIQPHLLYFKGQVPAQFREAFSAVLKERVDTTAVDSEEKAWGVLADDKPLGWTKGPSANDLCEKCGVAWLEAGKAFLTPPPPPKIEPKVETITKPAPGKVASVPAKTEKIAPQILAKSQHGSSVPIFEKMVNGKKPIRPSVAPMTQAKSNFGSTAPIFPTPPVTVKPAQARR